MKIKVGDYVRTKNGIAKIISECEDNLFDYTTDKFLEINFDTEYIDKEDIIKSSSNIIDLIEIGDYVNGNKVTKTGLIFPINNAKMIECHQEDTSNGYDGVTFCYSEKDIKSIVTKEQFEIGKYIVGD